MAAHIERIYDLAPRSGPCQRVLVDRLWPRGISKASADLDDWCKDVAPSTELRRWYGHRVERFEEFARLYRQELEVPPASDALALLRLAADSDGVTPVTATRDVAHSGARVLEDLLGGTGGVGDGHALRPS